MGRLGIDKGGHPVAHEIYGRQMSGGNDHEHIAVVCWLNGDTGVRGRSTREAMVQFIENGESVITRDQTGHPASVGVYELNGVKYLRSHADGKWTNNLLALPTC